MNTKSCITIYCERLQGILKRCTQLIAKCSRVPRGKRCSKNGQFRDLLWEDNCPRSRTSNNPQGKSFCKMTFSSFSEDEDLVDCTYPNVGSQVQCVINAVSNSESLNLSHLLIDLGGNFFSSMLSILQGFYQFSHPQRLYSNPKTLKYWYC